MCMAMDLDLLNSRRAEQESPFNANAIGSDSTNGEVGLITAIAQANNPATDKLDSLALAFDDTEMNGNSIARP